MTNRRRAFFEVLETWNREQGPAYQIRKEDLEWNLDQQKFLDYECGDFAGTPVMLATVSRDGLAQGISEKSLWLSLWGKIPSGREDHFLQAFVDSARMKHKTRLSWGGEEFHFTPGIPHAEDRLIKALRLFGFEVSEVVDFVGSLRSVAVSNYIDEGLSLAKKEGWQCREVESADQKKKLSEFLKREFAGRWSREYEFWQSREDTGRALWLSLHRNSDEIVGFARLCVRGRLQPIERGWNPCSLRLPLVGAYDLNNKSFGKGGAWSDSDSSLGPIGVAQSQRGQGAGKILLAFVLENLRIRNAELTCIDWTNAIKYYRPLEFVQARSFWTAWKSDSR